MKSIVIIGAGIAGLSAGIYARKNGFDSVILEMHHKPGGMCTSWQRGGYRFDYSIHNLAGTGRDAGLRKIWDELGALEGLEIINHQEFVRIEDPDGKSFTMYSDIGRTIAELRRISPEDEDLIRVHEKMGRRFGRMDMFAALMGGKGMLRMLPHLRTISKLTSETLEERGARFSDPFLRRAIPSLQYGFSNIPLAIHFVFQGGLDRGDLGSIKGGSLTFSHNLESKYRSLGGHIRYGKRVSEVIVKDDRAVGVRLVDGTEHHADVVISAADGRTTIYDMLGGRYRNELIDEYYNVGWWPKYQEMGSIVYLGVRRDLSDEPHALGLLLNEPLDIDGMKLERMDLEIYTSMSGLVQEGRGIIKVNLPCEYGRWRELKDRGGAYAQAKGEVLDLITEVLERRFPGIGGQVEARDMVTLVTCERFTGCFHGLQAWGVKRDAGSVMRNGLSRTLPGLDNFYMVGQWAEGTIGIPTAAVSGRRAIMAICKKHGQKFQV